MRTEYNNKLMVFESCPDFSDNSRGFWEYIVKNTEYKTYWVIRDEKLCEELKKHVPVPFVFEQQNQMSKKSKTEPAQSFD